MAKGHDLELIAALTAQFRALKSAFTTLSKQPGPSGVDGADGVDGVNGLDGRDGKDGCDGKDGKDGRDGKDGCDGKDGADGKPPKHEWSGSKLRFEQDDGTWGEWVDLKGPKGAAGKNGASGGGGFTRSFDLSGLPAASNAVPSEFIVKQGATWVRASFEQVQSWLGGTAVPSNALLTESGDRIVTESGDVIRWE